MCFSKSKYSTCCNRRSLASMELADIACFSCILARAFGTLAGLHTSLQFEVPTSNRLSYFSTLNVARFLHCLQATLNRGMRAASFVFLAVRTGWQQFAAWARRLTGQNKANADSKASRFVWSSTNESFSHHLTSSHIIWHANHAICFLRLVTPCTIRYYYCLGPRCLMQSRVPQEVLMFVVQ